jgi:hypothetical protein
MCLQGPCSHWLELVASALLLLRFVILYPAPLTSLAALSSSSHNPKFISLSTKAILTTLSCLVEILFVWLVDFSALSDGSPSNVLFLLILVLRVVRILSEFYHDLALGP